MLELGTESISSLQNEPNMNTPTHPTQVSTKRKLPLLIALVIILSATGSSQATMIVDAGEIGGNVVFTLSGSFNTASAIRLGLGFTNLTNQINPSTGFISFSGGP